MKKILTFVIILFSIPVFSQNLTSKNQKKADKILSDIQSAKAANDKQKIVALNTDLGNLYSTVNTEKAVSYYNDAFKSAEDPYEKMNLCLLPAKLYETGENYKNALKYYIQAEGFAEKTQNEQFIFDINLSIGDNEINAGSTADAVNPYQNALRVSLDEKNHWKVKKCMSRLIKTYELLKDEKELSIYNNLSTDNYDMIEVAVFGQKKNEQFKTELIDLKQIVSQIGNENKGLRDSILLQITNIEQLQKNISALSDTLKVQQAALKKTNTELVLKKSELTRVENYLENRNIALTVAIIIILIIGILAVLTYRGYIIKRRQHRMLEIQKQEIMAKNEEITTINDEITQKNEVITKKNEEITHKNEEITGSIRYAKRIQKALFPPQEKFKKLFPESFIFLKPRDIVSGDFYWISEKNNKIIVAAVDCTGHGVPGAFMSVLGMTFLDEIVNKSGITTANEILNELRANIIKSLHSEESIQQTKDGMDLALVVIDKENMKMEYSGAYNPLILIRDNAVIIYKADRKPAGFHDKYKDPFTNNSIDYQKDDRIFLSSDGYLDQFGGPTGKKFMLTHFSEMLLKSSNVSLEEQLSVVENTFFEWKGHLDQVDDVVVLGLKL
jgi:serine phosphatase RsbU (regulator of sigma subunit)